MSLAASSCTVPGCSSLIGRKGARGWCSKHYQRWLKTGDPEGSTALGVSERFWMKVRKTPACWIWEASKDENGYGMFKDSRMHRAHRWAYEHTVGPIPNGLVLDHLCRTPSCVNPAHLEPVTNDENLARGWGRRVKNHMVNSCINGHAFSPTNTYINPLGRKVCRTCMAQARNRYTTRKAA